MRVALASLEQAWLDKEANFSRCSALTFAAVARGCGLIVFPEMTLTGYCLDAVVAEPMQDSPTLGRFGVLARQAGIDVIFGASLQTQDSRPSNSLCVAYHDGRVEAAYAKMHPFTFAGEDAVFQAGQALSIIQVAGLRLGCGICYDLRFPEPFSAMAPDCDALVVIANWPARRVAHWHALLVARAIENQCYVLGVNRIGQDGNGLQYEKSTLLVAPDGSLTQPLGGDDELDVFDLDPEAVVRNRAEFPTVRDKRFSLYKRFWGMAA